MLREQGVVGKFVEFFGAGLAGLPLADRATIGNMSPEYGATCGIFPVDAETLRYLEFSGRPPERVELVEAYCREQGLFHDEDAEDAVYSDTLELDLGDVEPSLAGPKRPQDRVALVERGPGLPDGARRLRGRTATAEPRRPRRGASPSPSPPAIRPPPTAAARRAEPRTVTATRRVAEAPSASDGGGARPRRGRDRRDHELHQHLEPVGDARRRPARQEGGRGGPDAQAVGEDQPGARLEGRDRVPRARRPDRAARPARLQPRRLRLHHLHRQLGPAARGDLDARSRSATWSCARCCRATATSRAASTPR